SPFVSEHPQTPIADHHRYDDDEVVNLTKQHSRHSNRLHRNLFHVDVPDADDDVGVVQVADDVPVPSSVDALAPSRSEDAYVNPPSSRASAP
ncbi:hypothetical protein A2U01_0075851, partial [Trifolium medium]|nr:hypothetical protein [Trifolium medium]